MHEDCCDAVRAACRRDSRIREEIAAGRAHQALAGHIAHYGEQVRLCLEGRANPNIPLALSLLESLREMVAIEAANLPRA